MGYQQNALLKTIDTVGTNITSGADFNINSPKGRVVVNKVNANTVLRNDAEQDTRAQGVVVQLWNLPVTREKPKAPPEFFKATLAWEGTVTEIGDETFLATVCDRATKTTEHMTIPICEVDESDIDLLEEGALFYLTVGHRIGRDKRIERSSRLVFRRMPQWTRSTLERAKRKADELRSYFAD